MGVEDFIIPPRQYRVEDWQLGSVISNDLQDNSIALIFVSDYRGVRGEAEVNTYHSIRRVLYRLSRHDFELPISDLGNLISGRSIEDTYYILQEIVASCFKKGCIPVIVGGGVDLAYSLFSSVNFHYKEINYLHISNVLGLEPHEETGLDRNFVRRILENKEFSLNNFSILGYQTYLNDIRMIKLLREVGVDAVRLSEMMSKTDRTEPYFRQADLVTLDCNAVESRGEGFSIYPQVNGLNNREICAYMKEAGLSENLKALGIFNYNLETETLQNHQLMAEMLWYLIEGINIQKSHPKERHYETYHVMVDHISYAFKRDTFSGLWYFGDDDDIKKCKPCSQEDYDLAIKGIINERLTR